MGPIDQDIEHSIVKRGWEENWKDYFYCLDYSKEYTVTPKSVWMSIGLLPCDSVQDYGFEVNKECIADRE